MTNDRLWLGPLAFLLFIVGTLAIGGMTPGYSHLRQTVSELGEVGSPGRVAFTTLLCGIALCLVLYANAVARSLRAFRCPTLPAYFVGAMALSCAGVGLFAFPHPLHNVFGLSEMVGLQAPLVAALVCRGKSHMRSVTVFSISMYVAVVLAISINLMALVRPASLWPFIEPVFGAVQRSLFAAWFIWCAGYAVLLMRAAS